MRAAQASSDAQRWHHERPFRVRMSRASHGDRPSASATQSPGHVESLSIRAKAAGRKAPTCQRRCYSRIRVWKSILFVAVCREGSGMVFSMSDCGMLVQLPIQGWAAARLACPLTYCLTRVVNAHRE